MKRFINGITRIPVLGILLATLIFTSCEKDNTISAEDVVNTLESMENDATADYSYVSVTDDALDIAMEGPRDNNFGFQSPSASPRLAVGRVQACYIVTIDTGINGSNSFFPARVTIEFKDSCRGRDGIKRKFKIITEYTGIMRVKDSKATTRFENFYIDDTINVTGTHILTNVSQNNIPAFQRVVEKGRLTFASGRWIERNFNRTTTMSKGSSTLEKSDDEFTTTGTGNGSNSRGKTWTHSITQGLLRKNDCFRTSYFAPVSGVISFTHNASVGSIDYGDGTCDRKAILTINGSSREITLR